MNAPHKSTVVGQFQRLLGSMTLRQALTVYAEEWLGSLLRPIPSLLGFILRYLFYKVLFQRLGGFGYMMRGIQFIHSYGISMGRNHHINTGCTFDGRGGMVIGDNVLFGPNVVVVSSQHRWDLSATLPIIEQGHRKAKIEIGNDCWIGANAVVTPGVSLGEGTVVGAGSVVTSSTEPYSIVAGAPARKIGTRDHSEG